MDMSESIADLATALAKAQETMTGAAKDASNPAFKRGNLELKYATLASVWDAWQAVGPENGLALLQLPGAMIDGKVTLTTMLTHKSGQWMRETLSIPVTKQDAQGYGSALTYARRYALSAFVGIAPEDDDGNASVSKNAPQRPANEQTAPSGPITAEQLATLRKALDDAERDVAKFCAYYKIEALPDLPADKFDSALKAISAAVANAKKAA